MQNRLTSAADDGIVVHEVEEGRWWFMPPVTIAGVLVDKLGEAASDALAEMFDVHGRESAEYVMTQCADRFERRIVEETSKLRLEMAELRTEMREGFAGLRAEMAASRFELLKWAFAFWVGQLVGVASIVGLLVRTIPAR